jgi:hypothetical protein
LRGAGGEFEGLPADLSAFAEVLARSEKRRPAAGQPPLFLLIPAACAARG